MKLVTYETRGRESFGVLAGAPEDRLVIDLPDALAYCEAEAGRASDARAIPDRFGRALFGLVARSREALPAAERLLELHRAGELPRAFRDEPLVLDETSVSLLAPLPRPPSVRDGYAFRSHVETARKNRGLGMIPEF